MRRYYIVRLETFQGEKMKKAFSLFVAIIALGLLLQLVPQYAEKPYASVEKISLYEIAKSDRHFLVRSDQNDYIFDLPENNLRHVLAPGGPTGDLPVQIWIQQLTVTPSGLISAEVMVRVGGGYYDRNSDPYYLPLIQKNEIDNLEKAGLKAVDVSYNECPCQDPYSPAFYMIWKQRLTGSMRPHANKDDQGLRWKPSSRDDELKVLKTDDALYARNKQLNKLLRPLTFLKELFASIFFSLIFIGLGYFGPSG